MAQRFKRFFSVWDNENVLKDKFPVSFLTYKTFKSKLGYKYKVINNTNKDPYLSRSKEELGIRDVCKRLKKKK
jgi:hypothetical protein